MHTELDLIEQFSAEFLKNDPSNRVCAEDALRADLTGMKIYDEPIFGAAAADSPLFYELKKAVHPEAFLPKDFLSEAKSVLSFFLPFTEEVKRSNTLDMYTASDEWLHARIEGQKMLVKLGIHLCEILEKKGYSAVFPTVDPRFKLISPVISNWSERHIAYICGLGTFGISRGLITKKGVAGRFGSIITSAPISASPHAYGDPFEYCIMCGKCAENCPVNAIDITKGVINGKDQALCSEFVNASFRPPHGVNGTVRYGCGKCQTGVPCESTLPISNIR